MKEIIVILGTIFLGAWLVANIFVADSGFKTQGTSVVTKASTSISGIDD